MKFFRISSVITAVLSATATASAGSLRGDADDGHRVLQEAVEGPYYTGVADYENGDSKEFLNVELEEGMFELEGVPPGFMKRVNPESGVDTIKIPPGSTKSGGRIDLKGRDPTVVRGKPFDRRKLFDRRRLAVTTGPKSILVVRVVAPDASTTANEATLRDKWFGESGDPVNLASQYAACSHDQLIVTGGSTTANIGITVIGVNDGTVRNAVTSTTAVSSQRSNYDHTALCLPPGTNGGWIAYAYVNSDLSVYNNEWCNYVSGQMHEIGHNLNLAHSGEGGGVYEDQSGMMGYSYSSDNGPVMCFNNAKNWQIGWFEDAKLTVNVNTAWTGNVKGQVNYVVGDLSQDPVVIEVAGSPNLYVGFNHRVQHNSGTSEAGNLVTIQTYAGSNYGASTLVAKLGVGQSYTANGVTVTVDFINTSDNGFATISIQNGIVSPPTPPPTPAPTLPPTPPPTQAPVPPTLPPTPAPTLPPTPPPTQAPVPPTPPPTPPPTAACSSFTSKSSCQNAAAGCTWGGGKNKSCSGGGGGGDPTPPPAPSPPTPNCAASGESCQFLPCCSGTCPGGKPSNRSCP